MTPSTDNSVDEDLAKVHEEAIKAANTSWTETDKLYVSVCSALIALATLFGKDTPDQTPPIFLVGVLVLLLSINWAWLIRRYRKKILSALAGLAQEHASHARISQYYQAERRRFRRDWGDYLIVVIVGFASLVLMLFAMCSASATML